MTAEQIKAARLEKKMTQKEFAAWLGMSLSTVTKWEGGAPIPEWVVSKLRTPQTKLEITELTAEEIAMLERKAAAKGLTGDAFIAELIKSFLKLSVVLFAAVHILCSGAEWSGDTLTSTSRMACSLWLSLTA